MSALDPDHLALKPSFSQSGHAERQRILLLSPWGGLYPRGTFFCADGFVHADDDLAFTVVRSAGWRAINDDLPLSEFDWAWPNQMRLLGALLFCEVLDGPKMLLYPVTNFQVELQPDGLDLSRPEVVSAIKRQLLYAANEAVHPNHYLRRIRGCQRDTYALLEPSAYAMPRLPEAYRAIDPGDFVLLRGLQALIKADMLGRHDEFGEESVVATFIALEASFRLVLRKLHAEGVANPSAQDAAQWLHRHFDAPWGIAAPDQLATYFQDFYKDRIATLHPSSRYGDLPYSPTIWDDGLHLRQVLRQVFSFLVHGHHFDDFHMAVAEHRRRSPGLT